MKRRFEILFWRKVWYKALVEASNEEEAKKKFQRGEILEEEQSDVQPDYWEEGIIEVNEVS